MAEPVNHPEHYNQGGLEVIDIIDAFTKDCSGSESFYIGNIIKYVCRFKKKNGIEDLKKAQWYLSKLIEKENDSHNFIAKNAYDPWANANELIVKEDFSCKKKNALDALQKHEFE